MASKKKPISSADLAGVVASAAAGARQALAKGDLNGASVAMLTLSMAVANPSMGGAASGAHVPASAAAAAIPAAAEVLTAALERAAAVERETDVNDDALRAAVEAASISAGCLSALQFVLNERSAEEGRGGGGGEGGAGAAPPSRSSFEALEPLAALSRSLLEKIGTELSERSSSSSGDSAKNNPWTAKGALNNAASFAAALLDGFYGQRVEEEGEELEAAERDEKKNAEKNEGDEGDKSELVVVSPQALTSILDAASTCEKQKHENIRLLAVDLACVVTSSSAGSGELLCRREHDGSSSAAVVAALSRLLGSISSSSSDFVEVRIRSLMALAMTMSAELRLDERRTKKEDKSGESSFPSSTSQSPGASARAALISAPGAPTALVAAMKQSADADAKAVARGLFEEVARAEDSKAEMVAALERSGTSGAVEKRVKKLALA